MLTAGRGRGQRRAHLRAAAPLPGLHPGPAQALLVNNLDWTAPLSAIDFLRDVGKHFPINAMLDKDSVRNRLDGGGLTFTEFSYQLLQATDYLELLPALRLPAADRRHRPVGQHHRRPRPHPPGDRGVGSRADRAAGDERQRREVRQVDRRRPGVARSGAHLAVRLLPVLPQHRRPRRGHLPAAVHRSRPRRRSRSWRPPYAERPQARAAQRRLAAEFTALLHGPDEVDRVIAASEALFGRGALEDLPPSTLRGGRGGDPDASRSPATQLGSGADASSSCWRRPGCAPRAPRPAGRSTRAACTSTTSRSPTSDAVLTPLTSCSAGSTALLRRGKRQLARRARRLSRDVAR